MTLSLEEIGANIGSPVSECPHHEEWWYSSNKPYFSALRRAGWRVARPAGARYGQRMTFEWVMS